MTSLHDNRAKIATARVALLFCVFFLIACGLGYPVLNRFDPRQTPGLSDVRSEEHTSELQSLRHLVCRLLLEKKVPSLASVKNMHEWRQTTRGTPASGRSARSVFLVLGVADVGRIISIFLFMCFFFLINARPPDFPLFPHTTAPQY